MNINVSDVKLATENAGALKASANIVLDGVVSIYGAKVVERHDTGELFAAMPTKVITNDDGSKGYLPVISCKGEIKEQINKAVLDAYRAKVVSMEMEAITKVKPVPVFEASNQVKDNAIETGEDAPRSSQYDDKSYLLNVEDTDKPLSNDDAIAESCAELRAQLAATQPVPQMDMSMSQ